jgi:hypothetical protein
MAVPNYQEILDLLKNGLTLEAREKKTVRLHLTSAPWGADGIRDGA